MTIVEQQTTATMIITFATLTHAVTLEHTHSNNPSAFSYHICKFDLKRCVQILYVS